MTTTNGNRKILDLKRWEFCSPAPTNNVAAVFIISSFLGRQQQIYFVNATTHYLYYPEEDGWIQIPSGAFAGTFAAGACGCAVSVGPSGTATGGTTTTINTNLTIVRELRGYKVHITGGPNAGTTAEIASNTTGANAIITVVTPFGTSITASSTYRLITPRWYVLNAITASGTTTANVFKYYDFALNTWTAAETGGTDGVAPAAVIGTDGKLISTPSYMGSDYKSFATGTATAGAGTTLTNSGKSWTTNQWANYQIRITAGTGAGQIRTIASNTGTVITVSSAWSTNPDATSAYSIEGNDGYIYYMGSNAVTLYRYSISGGAWTTLSPGVARGAAPGVGMSGNWIHSATESDWTSESAILNGRYIYSFRGGAGSTLDRYDIAANSWANITYAPATETFTTGSSYVYVKNRIYIQKESTGRWFFYDVTTNGMYGWNTMLYPHSTAVLGDCSFDVTYTDGATTIEYIYIILNTSSVLLRAMII